MDDVLRVLDGRVGVCNRAGLLVGVGSASKQPSTMHETAIPGCVLAIGRVRGWIGAGKFYIWVARI